MFKLKASLLSCLLGLLWTGCQGQERDAGPDKSPLKTSESTAPAGEEIIKLVASNRMPNALFGKDVSVSGKYMVVGAQKKGRYPSAWKAAGYFNGPFIFERQKDGTWKEIQHLKGSKELQYFRFGARVALQEKTLMVSAISDTLDAEGKNGVNNAGAVYVFRLNQKGKWVPAQKLTAPERQEGAFFGNEIRLFGDYALIGASSETDIRNPANPHFEAGAVYLFKKNSDTKSPEAGWKCIQKLQPPDRDGGQRFGTAFSFDGHTLMIGAMDEDGAPEYEGRYGSGAVYIYEPDHLGQWIFKQKIIAPDRSYEVYELFGASVDFSGTWAMVGAPQREYFRAGKRAWQAGSVYFFQRNTDGLWTFKQTFEVPELQQDTWLGSEVEISGKFAFAGAEGDDLPEGDTLTADAGAIYVYELDDTETWQFREKLTAPDAESGSMMGNQFCLSPYGIVTGAERASKGLGTEAKVSWAGAVYLFPFPGLKP